jgi:hypothetical protein
LRLFAAPSAEDWLRVVPPSAHTKSLNIALAVPRKLYDFVDS